MGAITSATTVYATAYLTEIGRQYLFQDENHPRFVELSDGTQVDRLQVERFSLGDPDVNYKLPDLLTSGDIPDLSGENEGNITGAKGRTLTNLISPGEAALATESDTLEYTSSKKDIVMDLNKDLSKLETVITQELITLINQEATLEATYDVLPKVFGDLVMKDNELVINLLEPSGGNPGYRMRIIYPSIEEDSNIVTIQFETATAKTVKLKDYQIIAKKVSPSKFGSKSIPNQNNTTI
tara:strand:- start:11602 stop:12318 length:717 start_codon:yes stop_codon:yes gene_type:complete